MLSQDHDADVRADAGDQRDDATSGLAVPAPRSDSVARLLELTARDTDRWRAEAQAEAAEIVAAARQEAETLLLTAQREVARLQQVASDHDQRMRGHLHEMLERLDSQPR